MASESTCALNIYPAPLTDLTVTYTHSTSGVTVTWSLSDFTLVEGEQSYYYKNCDTEEYPDYGIGYQDVTIQSTGYQTQTVTVNVGLQTSVTLVELTKYISNLSDGTTTYVIKDAEARTSLTGKQDSLVSGTNIKTINNQSLLGSGNIAVESLPNQSGQSGKYLTTDGTTASWETNYAMVITDYTVQE